MSTPILPVSPSDVNSLRVDLEHVDAALRLMIEARAWLRGIDLAEEARTALTGALADTYAARRCIDAALITLESREVQS